MTLRSVKRLTDPEFLGWKPKHPIRPGLWIYFSPDNSLAALVDSETSLVLLIQEIRSKVIVYKDEALMRKAAERGYVRKLI